MGYIAKEGDSFSVPIHFNTNVSLYKNYKLSILPNFYNNVWKTTEMYMVVICPHIVGI